MTARVWPKCLQMRREKGRFQRCTLRHFMSVVHEIEQTVSELIFAGVPERYPRLQIVCTDAEIGCVARCSRASTSLIVAFARLSTYRLR
jgi:hypothetical protein